MIKYSVTMGIRIACIVAMLFVHSWWLIVFGAGAVFLPYVAVVIANASRFSTESEVERPGSIVPSNDPASRNSGSPGTPTDERSEPPG